MVSLPSRAQRNPLEAAAFKRALERADKHANVNSRQKRLPAEHTLAPSSRVNSHASGGDWRQQSLQDDVKERMQSWMARRKKLEVRDCLTDDVGKEDMQLHALNDACLRA